MTISKPCGRIAVAGATGRVGGAVADLLAAGGHDIVALTRRPEDPRLGDIPLAGIDFARPETLQAALRGTDQLFLSQGSSLQQVDNEIALIDAAVSVGLRHIVKLSALGPATRLYPFSWHMQIEAHLARQPVASTVLRPSAFADILKRAGSQVAAGAWAGSAGDGRINFIDIRDIAKVAVFALSQDVSPESQRVYHLTGDRSWTMAQVAAALSELLKKPVEYHHRTPDEQHTALLASGLPLFVSDLLVGLEQLFRESVLGETTRTIEDLTGAPPRPLTDWLAENIDSFRR